MRTDGGLGAQFHHALLFIVNANPFLVHLILTTLEVVGISTGAAVLIGLPVALALGLGNFRGRRLLLVLSNAGLALPSVVVGVLVLLVTIPDSAFASLGLASRLRGVEVVQTILALPFIVSLSAAAFQDLPAGLLDQARLLGAGRRQMALLALREARIGVLAAVISAAGVVLSEIGAVVIVGGNIERHDQTLASALLEQFNPAGDNGMAIAIGLVLLAMILVLAGLLTVVQVRTRGVRFRMAVR